MNNMTRLKLLHNEFRELPLEFGNLTGLVSRVSWGGRADWRHQQLQFEFQATSFTFPDIMLCICMLKFLYWDYLCVRRRLTWIFATTSSQFYRKHFRDWWILRWAVLDSRMFALVHPHVFLTWSAQVLKLSFNRLEELPEELSLFSSLWVYSISLLGLATSQARCWIVQATAVAFS